MCTGKDKPAVTPQPLRPATTPQNAPQGGAYRNNCPGCRRNRTTVRN